MSNSNARQRTGFPPQRPAPAEGGRHDPQNPHDEPVLSWPPANPQHPPQGAAWPHDEQGGRYAEQDGYYEGQDWQQPQPGNPPAQTHAPNGYDRYADPYGRGADDRTQPPYPEDAFAPQSPHDHAHRGHGAPQQGGQASPYAAQFEAYVPPSVASDPNTGRPVFGDGYAAPQHEPQLRGSAHEDAWPPTQPPQRGYAHGDAAPYPHHQGYHPEQQYGQEPQPYGGDQWREAGHHSADGGYPAGAYAADPYAYPPDQYGAVDPALSAGPQSVAVNEEYEDYDEEYDAEDEPRPGRSRLMMIAGGLVGAVVVGAGLAYGYKTFGVGGADVAGGPPVVRGDGLANKALPNDPGGRKFDHTDSKVMRRISQEGRTSADGTRRVSTMMIGRDGRVVETAKPAEPSDLSPTEPVVSVPGLTVVDGFAGQRAAREAARASAAGSGGGPIVVTPPKTNANALSPVRPVSVTEPPKSPPAVAPPTKAPEQAAVVAPAKTKTAPVAQPRPSAPAASSPAPSATPSAGAKGYVAVLASVPVSSTSRLEALKTFADIQQNYGNVLKNRTPDVRQADLGAKGNYHRLMVGPPASKESANALCKELKSAGYPSCWITSY